MGVKKFQSIFIRYVLFLALGILIIIAANVGLYSLCINSGVVFSLPQINAEVELAKQNLQTTEQIITEYIPDFCEYAVFSTDGLFLNGSVENSVADDWWKTCVENHKTSSESYMFALINKSDEVLILRYRATAQFQNRIFRQIFPVADLLLVGIVLIEVLAFLFILSYVFGNYIARKMDSLRTVIRKIEQQDLDFQCESSQIFEIDQALDAINHMKFALKQSLTRQWQDDKMRQDQLSALAHDLKTPLTIIRGNTELLFDTALSGEQRECVDYIEISSKLMQNYVQTLIEVTKSWDCYQLHVQKVSITLLLQEIKDQITGLCTMNNITLHWDCRQQTQDIVVDQDLFVRAIVNVVSNAIEHTPPYGVVSLEVWEEKGNLLFAISDTGPGFTTEALKHATEQFFMDDNSRNSKFHYGIGLYVAASTIRKHGGQLILENSKETGGARVIINIPNPRLFTLNP